METKALIQKIPFASLGNTQVDFYPNPRSFMNMEKKSFKDFGIDVEQPTPEEVTSVDFSQMKNGFYLSKIDVSGNEPANESDFSEIEIAKIKKDLGAEEIPKDEAEKFGLEDHPLHIEHMRKVA